MRRSKLLLGFVAAAIGVATVFVGALPVGAAKKSITICSAYGDGTGASGGTPKIDVNGDVNAVFVSAPSGYLISGYCVKAGTQTTVITVSPPVATLQLTAPNGKDVSHYSL